MSAILVNTDNANVNLEPGTASTGGLDRLVQSLADVKSVPAVNVLKQWLAETRVGVDELRPYLGFKPGTYARHLVFRNSLVELLVLCWRPGQRTPIHDHNGSYGAVLVVEGVLWETLFGMNDRRELCYLSACQWLPGDVTAAEVPDIHQLGNPDVSGQNLVTLHLYAPPLGVLNTYRVGSKDVGRYSPGDFMDGAGI